MDRRLDLPEIEMVRMKNDLLRQSSHRPYAHVLFPDRAPIYGTSVNVIPLQQPIPFKRANMPTACTRPNIFRITIDDANFWIVIQDSNPMFNIAGSQTVICIQGKDIFSF